VIGAVAAREPRGPVGPVDDVVGVDDVVRA
jgi:hypothetical protein